jgi:glycosyltransferase involved in cell wall biosynthesis
MELKPGISVCIIAKNEEHNIAECIDSVRSIAGEIIAVDTGSTDATASIATDKGCIVIHDEWRNDFSYSRNIALANAKHEFIFSIDADERLVNPEVLLSATKNAKPETGGWLIEVKSIAENKNKGTDVFVSNLLRLFRNHPQIRFTGKVHEQVIKPILALGLKLQNTKVELLHTGYAHSAGAMDKKHLRNLDLLNEAINEEPRNSYYLFQRAKTNLALGKLTEAESDIKVCLGLAKNKNLERVQILNFGALAAMQLQDKENSKARALESLGILPVQAFASFILGEVYHSEKNYAFAFNAYNKIDEAIKSEDAAAKIAGDYYLPPEQLHFKKGKCLIGLGMIDDAEREFREAYRLNPHDSNSMVGLANIEYKKGRFENSLVLLNEALKIADEKEDIKRFIAAVENNINKTMPQNKPPDILPKTVQISSAKDASSDKMLLSLSMIVKNEEEFLPGCLESVKGIVDEIVIVDTGSNDRTKEIANSFGAKIYDFKWCDDFAAARNESLKQCRGEWILYLDADERLNSENSGNIRRLLQNASDETGGLIVTIESEHLQLDGDAEFHRGGYPRIFRNYGFPNVYFKGKVHEQITPSIFALNKNIDFSDITITHLGYNRSREVMEEKVQRNYRMLIKHVQEEPLNGYAWYQLGQTLAQMRLAKEAESSIRFAIESGSLSKSVFASAAATLAQLVGNRKSFEESLYWSEKSLEKAPGQVYGLNLKAYSLLYLNRLEEAEAAFLEVLERQKQTKGVPRSGFDIAIPNSVVMHGLNEARKKIGKNSL